MPSKIKTKKSTFGHMIGDAQNQEKILQAARLQVTLATRDNDEIYTHEDQLTSH